MNDIERPKKCPFLLNYHEKYGESKDDKKWKCEIENIWIVGDDLVTEMCVNGYQKCAMFSKGIHYRDIPKVCPVFNENHETCFLRERTGTPFSGCGCREQYEYLECELFSKWFYERRRGMNE